MNEVHDLLVANTLLVAVVRDLDKAAVQLVQLGPLQPEAEIGRALRQRMPAAVLSEHQPAFRHAHALRVDDLVSGLLLQIPVLMDAGLVRKGVLADDGLVRLGPEGDDLRKSLTSGIQLLGDDAGLEGIPVRPGLHDHDHFFQRGVPRALTDAVDGTLDLPRAGLDRGQRIGDGEAQVVVAVHAHDGAVPEGARDAADDLRIVFGNGVADGIRQVDGPRARFHHGARDLFEVIEIGARGVFSRKLHVIGELARELHRGAGLVKHLLAGLFQLVLQMDVAGGDEGVDARPAGVLQRCGGTLDVAGAGPAERGDLYPRELAAYGLHGFKVALRSYGKAGLEDIDAKLHQLLRHAQLLGYGHAASGRLFAVPQRSVKDVNAIGQ